ncbi:hypothetical protein Tco_1503400 [Tanacetum coccineum]
MAKSHKRRHDNQDPPSPPSRDSGRSKKKKHDSDASASKQPPVQKSSAWKTFDTREAPSSSSKKKFASLFVQPVDDFPIPDDVHLSESEDTGVAHLPKIKTRPDWLKPVPEEDTPETPKPDWVILPNDLPKTENNWVDALAKTYNDPEENKLLQKTGDMGSFIKCISLQFQMEECHLLLTDQIDLVNPEGDKERRKAAYYPDFGLEEFVLSLWIKSEHDYDISATYGISHWWFKRKEFYITRHSSPSNRHTVISHMRILSVVSLKTFSRYGYTYLKEIVLHRADYKEYKISEADFKNLHPNDFEDLNIVIRQCVEELQLGIESYQTKLNLTQPSWDATDFLFKENYITVHKPRAVIYRDRNNQKKMMRETEFNPGMEHRILSGDDKRRSQEFVKLIERRLKIRRIFRSLKSFVSGRLRDVDYRLI